MTPTSRAALAVGVCAVVAGAAGAGAGIALLVAVVVATVADALMVRRPPAGRLDIPPVLPRGLAYPYRIDITEGTAWGVAMRQPAPPDVTFAPNTGAASIEGSVVASRRGHHEIPAPAVRLVGPLGLGAWYHRLGGPTAVTVYPDTVSARRLARAVATGRFREQGRRRRGRIGIGTEFDAVREYDDNDDIRFVNWSATLRLGRPMTNQFRIDQDRDIICVVDCGRLMAAPLGAFTRLDAAVDAVAALAFTADELGDRAGVVAFGGQVLRDVRPARRGGNAVVSAVHDLEPEDGDSDYEAAFRLVARHKRALVVLFTDLLDESAAVPLLEAIDVLARRHAVVVAVSTDEELVAATTTPPDSLHDVLRASVASAALSEQGAVVARIRHRGVRAVEARGASLPAACVAAYLDTKANARV